MSPECTGLGTEGDSHFIFLGPACLSAQTHHTLNPRDLTPPSNSYQIHLLGSLLSQRRYLLSQRVLQG